MPIGWICHRPGAQVGRVASDQDPSRSDFFASSAWICATRSARLGQVASDQARQTQAIPYHARIRSGFFMPRGQHCARRTKKALSCVVARGRCGTCDGRTGRGNRDVVTQRGNPAQGMGGIKSLGLRPGDRRWLSFFCLAKIHRYLLDTNHRQNLSMPSRTR